MRENRLPVTQIQRFCTHDGPGLRTTVFLKGCPLRCVWCHNPETQSALPEFFYNEALCIGCGACQSVCPAGAHALSSGEHRIDRDACVGCMACARACPSGALEACAAEPSIGDILNAVLRDRAFFGQSGGLTLSGGEPLLHAGPVCRLLREAKTAGLHTAVETCGFFEEAWLSEAVPVTDLFLWDFKDSDEGRHLANTGVSLQPILKNLRAADEQGAPIRLRCILIRSVNLTREHLEAIAGLYASLRHAEGVELLPYHTYGASKGRQLGRENAARPDWIPTQADLKSAKAFLRRHVRLLNP